MVIITDPYSFIMLAHIDLSRDISLEDSALAKNVKDLYFRFGTHCNEIVIVQVSKYYCLRCEYKKIDELFSKIWSIFDSPIELAPFRLGWGKKIYY